MKTLLILLLVAFCLPASSNDSVFIRINKLRFAAGDTVSFSCNVANFKTLGLESATMNVWIEDVNRTSLWRYRYPMINGALPKTKLVISDSIKPGIYAINFAVQKGLYSVYGKIRDYRQKPVNYFLVTKDGKSHLNTITPAKGGEFAIENIVFDHEASLIFTPDKSKATNDLFIDLLTPLDSAFVPAVALTQLITLGVPPQQDMETSYEFDWDAVQEKNMLPHVTVTARQKKTIEHFSQEYTSPFFRQDDNHARWLNGLEDPHLSGTANLKNFLISRVPNLTIDMDYVNRTEAISLRGEPVTVYLNEMAMPPDFSVNDLNPADIALIKVINGPTMINRFGNGAAILIYTRRGDYYTDPRLRHNFVLSGYTPQVAAWK